MGRLVKLEKEPERRIGDLNAGTGKKGRLVLIDTEPQRRLGELGKSAAAPAAAEKPAPKPSLAGASRAVTDTGTGDAAAERGARRQRYERQLRDIQKQQHARQLGAKNTAGAEEIEEARQQAELRKRLATLDLIDNYGQRNHEDTYGGYIKSQYDIGQLGQDQARAWSAVMRNPTAANLEYAQHVDSMIEDYTQRNQQALDPTGNHLFYSENAPEWLQKAGKWADETIGANVQYLPQAKEQFFASIVPAVLGLMAGDATGGKLGYSLGTALYSASTMAGSAYQALRELGADHETAKQLATDEAFLSSLIEGADTFADLSLFGFGKAAGKLGANVGKAGLVQAAKQFGASGAGKALGFLGNIAQEGLEEGTQQAVSIANRERYLRGYDPAEENFFQQVGGLTGDAARIFWNGLKRDDPNHQEILESAKGGAQVAIGMGALGFGTGAVTNRVMGDITGLNDPRNAFLYEGQSQGMTDPRAQLMQETEPAARPVTEPVTGNVTEPVTENAPPALQAAPEQPVQPVQPVQPAQQAQDGEAILNALAGDMAREEARQNRALREQEAARREQEYLQAVQTQNRILEETEAQADAERYAMSAEVARKSGGGLLQDEYTDTLDRRDMTVLDAAARQLGVTVSFAGEINHGLAEGQITGRAITLQRDAESPLRQLFGHEIAHRLRDLAPKEFDRFVQAVKAADPDFSGKVAEMLALGQRADEQYSEPIAIEDVAADYAGMLLDKPQTLETFIAKNQHNPTLLQRLGQIFRELAQRLKGKLTGQQRTQAENAAAALEKAYAAAVKAERKNGAEREGVLYSLKKVPPVKPTNADWSPGASFDQVKKAHPTLFELAADEADTRNPTQITGTVKSYRKIYDKLRAEGFDGTILDASSGLGYGTRAGRTEYGFSVDDIEPFPDAKYHPNYTDYSTLGKTYDVIISNAVLNVIPQDLRDAMVVKIGKLLNPGGRAFINVRGSDVKNAGSKVAINADRMEYFISNTGSYQKGFTSKELVSYLRDALGDGFTVEPTKEFGAVSAVVTKGSGAKEKTRYSFARLRDKSIRQQAEAMERSGSSPEEIWETLGVARTMDGKGWRFEIDDSGMRLRGDAADLSDYTTLGELVDAPELFEAYPQLKDVRFVFADLEDGERGYFSSGDNTIVLSEELRGAPEDTLVHEIQHAIQDVEGFASGASPEYWAWREYESGDLVTERLQREYDRTMSRLSRADQNRYIRYMELERELDRLFLSDENSEDGKRYAKLEAEQDALYEALYPNQWFRDLLDLNRRMTDAPGEYRRMYENTAGEIEARDAASRRRMTSEERRATMPKVADENTVFAEDAGWNRSFDYDPETASIKEQIEQSREELNKMEVVARETVPENLPNKDAAAKWAADRLKASGYKVDRQGFGEILFTKKDLDKGLRYADTPAEKAALAALPKVLKRGIEIGDHTNHKKREKQTVTFAAPVELNGVRGNMGVVINRNGNHYYAHRIVLPDGTVFQFSGINKDTTQELSRGVTVSGSLADTTSVVSTDSVRGFDENVNPRYSLKRDAALEKDFASIREQLEAGELTEEQADRLRGEAVDRAAQRTPDFKALEQENAALRKRVERLQRQTKITERPVVREGDISRLANDLLKGYESRADRREIQKQLRALGDFIVQNGSEDAELTWDTAKERAMAIANQIVEQASVLNDSTAEDYREIRQYFRETPLVISKEDSADIPDFADFKRSQRGRLRVQLGERGNIGSVFSDIAARWPGFFNAEDTTNPGDQLARMADVLEALRPVYENPYGGSMGYVKEAVANDILDGLLSQQVRQEAATFADRQAQRLQEQRDRYLSILEKEKAKRREAVAATKEEQRGRYLSILEKEKAKRREAVAAAKAHGKQELRLQAERRGQSQRREQIKRHIGALSARLLNPSDSKNIPEGLRQPIARALSLIDLDSKRTGDDRRQALQALRSAYLDIIRDGSSGVVVDPELLGDSAAGAEGMLEQLAAMRSVPLAEMNRAELETVWKVVRSLEHAVSTAGKTLASQKFETTKDWALAFASDASGRRSKSIILKGAFPRMQDMLDPRSFFDQYGESGLAVWRMLRNAQDSVTQKVQMVAEQVGDVIDADLVRRARRETHTFTTEEGKELTLTTGQIMNLYNLMQREQAQEHLMKGGVIQPEVGTGRKKIARGTEAIRLTLNDQQRIVSVLDPQARIAAQTLQRLTTGLLADWGNEASLKAYGYRKFTEKNYWPIKSAAEELHSNVEKGENNTRSIKNIGMAKNVIPHANNALELGDALDVFARHTADMVEYSSWLLPMEDANRLFNFAFRDEKGNRTGKTIKGELNRVGGAGSTQYWQRLMEDIQNGIRVRADTNAERSVGRIVGNAKGAAVGANLRVVLQQPTAFLRANAVISPASLSKGLVKGVTGGNGWRKAVRWAGIARIKEVGGFDQGGFRTINQQLYGRTGFLDRASAAAGLSAEKADAVTWGALWNASEWETRRLHPALEAGSDAFYRRTAEIFTDLIEQSQVVDGVLQRSQIMRSGNAFNQMATAFMGEPLKTLNMLLRSLDKLRYETDGKKRSAARKQLGRTAAALVVTSVVNAAAQSLVDAARDDDEDKDYKKRFLKAFVGLDGDEKTAWQIAGAVLGLEGDEEQISDVLKALAGGSNLSENLNPIGWIPYTKEILSAMQGFEVSRADAAVVSDVVNAVTVTLDAAQGKGKKTLAYALRSLIASVSTMLGVPAKALTRDLWAGVRTAAQEAGNWKLLYAMNKAVYKPEQNKKRYMDLLYRAKQTDPEAYEAIRKDMLDHGWFENAPKDEYHTLTMTPRETAEAYIDRQMENRRREDAVSGEEADKAYSSLMDAVKENPWYTQTRPETKNRVADAAQDLSQRNAAGEKLQDKLDENGVNAENYLWYLIYLDKFDQPNRNGNYGTYTQEERKAAIDALKVDRQTSSGLWIFSGGSAKNNPYK